MASSAVDQRQAACNGTITFDDRGLGLNNQLLSLGFMLCLARTYRACALVAPPLGYTPCSLHNPGTGSASQGTTWIQRKRICNTSQGLSLLHARELVELSTEEQLLLNRGDEINSRAKRCPHRDPGMCKECGPYNINPYRCVKEALEKGQRVFMLYAFGLTRHLRKAENPQCMGGQGVKNYDDMADKMPLRLSARVRSYTDELMGRLGLQPGRYVAAQYRMGVEWKTHVESPYVHSEWGCYGMGTINASLVKWQRRTPGLSEVPLAQMPRFLLTNRAPRLPHAEDTPLPISVLSEIRIVALAHTALLNPLR